MFFFVGRVKLQRNQFLSQFASNASAIIPPKWTAASMEFFGQCKPKNQSLSYHSDMGKCFSEIEHLLGGNKHLKCGIR